MASLSSVLLRGALFQRKSRSGWLEELDGIREDALTGTDGHDADTDDIWTDLRDGGEYSDPHEISSLYATDETPDLPVTHKGHGKQSGRSGRGRSSRDAEPPVTIEHHEPAAVLPPPPPPPAPAPDPAMAPPAAFDHDDPWAPNVDASATHPDADQIWVQPAPHPMRPSEMWHPAELAPAPLPEQPAFAAEERVEAADLLDDVDPAAVPGVRSAAATPDLEAERIPAYEDAPADRLASELEAELVAAADLAVVDELHAGSAAPYDVVEPQPVASADLVPPAEGGLVAGPVGRRVRRDRPRATLPDAADLEAPTAAPLEDRSPLPEVPLPPAALPTRANRLPSMDELPATPSSVVAPAPAPVAPSVVEAEPEPVVAEPAAAEPAAAEPVAVEPTVAVEEVPLSLVIAADGMVRVPGTLVRLGGAQIAAATTSSLGCAVDLQEGWCWVAPGDGAGEDLHIELPAGLLHVAAGSTVLAVSESDRSAFVIVAVGAVTLYRGSDEQVLPEGSICMIDAAGGVQVDMASVAEIEADPIVAENLSLDAEL